MNENSNRGCCSGEANCCGSTEEIRAGRRQITIDFLYLDLSVCTRCQGAENSLDQAIKEVAKVLEATDADVQVNKINISTKELAAAYKFLSSPTIRVNGRDIQLAFKESLCESCGDLCGDAVDCRVWIYRGQEYTEPPTAMVVEGILQAVYGGDLRTGVSEQAYIMPENLKHFYEAMENKKTD